jgi:phosphohistidine phosphatase
MRRLSGASLTAAELWLLRHGDAVAHGSTASDSERELTERGREQARIAGLALRRLGVEFAVVYASPKVRARDTAQIACEAMGAAPPTLHLPLAEGFQASDALGLARRSEGERILLVGHNPDLPQIVYDTTGGHVTFKKGGVAAVEFRDRLLLALLRPSELEAIAQR